MAVRLFSSHRSSFKNKLVTQSKEQLVIEAERLGVYKAQELSQAELLRTIEQVHAHRSVFRQAHDVLKTALETTIEKTIAMFQQRRMSSPTKLLKAEPKVEHASPAFEPTIEAKKDLWPEEAFSQAAAFSHSENILKNKEPISVVTIEPEAFHATEESFVEPSTPSMLDDAPLPMYYGVNECVAIPVEPTTLYVYWEARPESVDSVLQVLQQSPQTQTIQAIVRVICFSNAQEFEYDYEIINVRLGDYFVYNLPTDLVVRVAIGFKNGETFLPIAHTLEQPLPASQPSTMWANTLTQWSESLPQKQAVSHTTAPTFDVMSHGSPVAQEKPNQRLAIANTSTNSRKNSVALFSGLFIPLKSNTA